MCACALFDPFWSDCWHSRTGGCCASFASPGVGGGHPAVERVLRANEHDRAAPSLLEQDAERLPRREEVTAGEDGEVELPGLEAGLEQRRARRDARGRDQDVDAAVGEHDLVDHPL